MKWTNQDGILFWKFTNHMASSSQIQLQTTLPNNKEEVNFLTICSRAVENQDTRCVFYQKWCKKRQNLCKKSGFGATQTGFYKFVMYVLLYGKQKDFIKIGQQISETKKV